MTMCYSGIRRVFVFSALLSACWITLPQVSFCDAAVDRPNVILIFADDLGYGDIPGFGQPETTIEAPNFTRLMEEGARLTHCYVTAPTCGPSRGSLMTGRYPFRNGLSSNPIPDIGRNNDGLPPSEITIAEALQDIGYATSCIGKWHMGHIPQYLPRRQGFDEYYGILYSNDMRPVQLVENEQVVEYPVIQATLTRRYTEHALDFIERNVQINRPFFLYLPHVMPHIPLAASGDFYTPETPDDLYADVIRELDWSMGQILDKLQELNIDNSTLVIFTSDNGPWMGGSTGGLRGMKARTWEGGIRVPFLARMPGRIPAGIVNNSVASTIDMFPTILNLVGARIPEDRIIDGRDIWQLFMSETAESPHEAVFAGHGGNLACVRSGRWKLHVRSAGNPIRSMLDPSDSVADPPQSSRSRTDPRGPDGVTIIAPFEQASGAETYPGVFGGDGPGDMILFDLELDPSEQHNVADQYPEIVRRLKTLFDQMIAQTPQPSLRSRRSARERKPPRILRLKGGSLRYDDEY